MIGRDHPYHPAPQFPNSPPPAVRRAGPAGGFITDVLALALIGVSLAGPARAAEAAPIKPEAQGSESGSAASAAPKGAVEDIAVMLPLLMTTPERKQLALEIEAALRKGDVESAEQHLINVVEASTLAIILIDHLREPNLLASLRNLGIESERTAASDPGPSTPAPAVAKLQEALDREKARSETAARELAALSEKVRDFQNLRNQDANSASAKLIELQSMVQREQAQRESAAREAAAAQEKLTALKAEREREAKAHAVRMAELQEAALQERTRGDAVSRESATTREKLAAIQAEREREAKAHATRMAELQEAALQERTRGDAVSRESATTREKLAAIQAEREREAKAHATRMAELQEALLRERARGDSFSRELAGMLDELRADRLARDAGPIPSIHRLEMNGVPAPVGAVPANDLSQGTPLILVTGAIPSPADEEPTVPKATPALEPRPAATALSLESQLAPPRAGAISPPVEDRLLTRADALLRKGDVSGARLLLERSLEAGNARAAFLLAETFDPHVLSGLGVVGIRGDAEKAREYYAKALDLGIGQAGERIQALK